MKKEWERTAQYYESLASLEGRDPYSQRALLWYAGTCRAQTHQGAGESQTEQPEERLAKRAARGE